MAEEVCCWQCSEYCVNIPYVLNAIIDLKKKKISSSFKNILDKLNAGDELNEITEELLTEILNFACNNKYVSTATYNNNTSYRVSNKHLGNSCNNCGETLSSFSPGEIRSKQISRIR